MTSPYLPGHPARARRMRLDTASLLKRFFFCEQALVVAQSGWLAAIAPFEVKTALPRLIWEDAMTANALRERVFELHYPSRLMQIGDDAPWVELTAEAINAPSAEAFVLSLARVFQPTLLAAYREYLAEADEIADGPTLRFLHVAVQEKEEHVATLTRFAEQMLATAPAHRAEAEAWAKALSEQLKHLDGISLDEIRVTAIAPDVPGRRPFQLAEVPARDSRFHLCRFYWPDTIDPDFPYGEGIKLQLRSAVSHLNEVWAVEAAGVSLYAFAEALGWEFIFDAARWTYDESRHCRMGDERLRQWGFEPYEIPLGTYIYDSARGQSPVYRLGMLSYFEMKNIGKKTQRARAFAEYGDHASQHDMEFDWADETIHAHYGTRWLAALRESQPEAAPEINELRARCNELVAQTVATATEAERADIHAVAQAMIEKAERMSRDVAPQRLY